ncbi:CU044_5270 family protein [Streptomyces chryseus]|uniref:CU044_5270 family protein n=1 Tax=Streptomyces chryseus TaxID=68186 RepID=UPI00199186F8|nr:CU044_5270 family protein [Streptomyces chryseus]GGX02922.1 hypothetical protein GCM10010353_18020 [Streptomyces chryseus]
MNDFPRLPERELPPGRHRVLKEHLMRETQPEPAPVRKTWRRPAFAVPLAAAAVAGATVFALSSAGPGGGGGAQPAFSPEAVGLLEDIALAAQRADVPDSVRDDQFVYIESRVGYVQYAEGKKPRFAPVHKRETWKSVDGTREGLLREKGENIDNGEIELEPDTPGIASNTNYRHLQTLPTDPAKMLDWLHRTSEGGKSEDQNTFVLVGDLIHESLMPPEVSAALYRAAAKIPGVVVVPDAVDAAGRHGVAVAREDDGILEQLIFDKETKAFLGEREVVVEDTRGGLKKGDLAGTSAVLERSVVDEAGRTP